MWPQGRGDAWRRGSKSAMPGCLRGREVRSEQAARGRAEQAQSDGTWGRKSLREERPDPSWQVSGVVLRTTLLLCSIWRWGGRAQQPPRTQL